jgi:ribosomal protein S18 acetylase RimI-like enzyme
MPTIRSYHPDDLAAVSDVCNRTGDVGKDARELYTNHDLLPDLFARPYLIAEPELAYVVDDAGVAVGYILGTANTEAYVAWFRDVWLPQVAHRHPLPEGEPRNLQELFTVWLHRPEWMLRPELVDYPAHLHIDLLPQYQRQGLGRALMTRFLSTLYAAGTAAVHLSYSNLNTNAAAFYQRMGFRVVEIDNDVNGTYVVRSTA